MVEGIVLAFIFMGVLILATVVLERVGKAWDDEDKGDE